MLGNNKIECYVSDTGKRLITLGGMVNAIANIQSGKLGDYVEIKALRPYLNADSILGELMELNLVGSGKYFNSTNQSQTSTQNLTISHIRPKGIPIAKPKVIG